MPPTRPLFSIIIPHLNQSEALEACLRTLDGQTIARTLFEVIVVDNGSFAPPYAVLQRSHSVRLLEEPAPGPGLARNRGADAATGDILCFIDADCRAHPNWLEAIARGFELSTSKTILGGDVKIWRRDATTFTALEAYESIFAYRFKLYIERHGYSGTGNLAVRREDFYAVGPFAGIHLAEDIEWGKRARAAGFTFRYVPEMIVFHPARGSIKELFVKWDRHIQHAFNSARGRPGWRTRWSARALAVFISPVVDVGKIWTSGSLVGASVRAKASVVLVAVRFYRALRMITILMSRKEVLWNRENNAKLKPQS